MNRLRNVGRRAPAAGRADMPAAVVVDGAVRAGVRIVVHVVQAAAVGHDPSVAPVPAVMRHERIVIPVMAGVADPTLVRDEAPGRIGVVGDVGGPVPDPDRDVAGAAPRAVGATGAEVVEAVGVLRDRDVGDAGVVGRSLVVVRQRRRLRARAQQAEEENPQESANISYH